MAIYYTLSFSACFTHPLLSSLKAEVNLKAQGTLQSTNLASQLQSEYACLVHQATQKVCPIQQSFLPSLVYIGDSLKFYDKQKMVKHKMLNVSLIEKVLPMVYSILLHMIIFSASFELSKKPHKTCWI